MLRMNGAYISFYAFFCLVASAQCYDGKGYDPLREFLEGQRLKRQVKFAGEDSNSATEYSPVYVGRQDTSKEDDKITALPGQPDGVNFDQYSGYVTVDPNNSRALFYYFTESENASTKPLVLWLNGGPGCSSFNGAMKELGPFRVNEDRKTLWRNEYAWNKVANILFLDSPAGVGFSFSHPIDDRYGDEQTAADTYLFLVNWLERFPEYKNRDFFLTGESYAGHYVPQLAKLILDYNKLRNHTVINLQRIAIGNAYVDYETEKTGTYDFFWSHSLISDTMHKNILSTCNFSSAATTSEVCVEHMSEAKEALNHIFIYDIYAPRCSLLYLASPLQGYDPCTDYYVHTYLNTPEVKKALHVNPLAEWDSCNEMAASKWSPAPETVLPTIKQLMESGIGVWLYSGDTDGRVTVTTTRYSIAKMGVSVQTPWYPWEIRREVYGYVEQYQNNLTFVTIRGAGHFVPSGQPARALAFFSYFIEGKLPSKFEK